MRILAFFNVKKIFPNAQQVDSYILFLVYIAIYAIILSHYIR
ncbi:hypothetical protein HNQ03_002404 [Chryseobacterium sp. 16F]|uniref:Uncharacterized protein n=1 Tax=Frigoriflavimonas asaccharolytica TaxID=2735899 RepID=A0A8J8K9Q5_9FLAO|nr:hypothetical protein [Frigoriflavimonas asaccharolytica]